MDWSSQAIKEEMMLDDKVMRNMNVARTFAPHKGAINSIDFNQTGQFFISTADDDTLFLYNCEEAKICGTSKSTTYGIRLARFTRDTNIILHASSNGDDAIICLSLSINKHIQKFNGHTHRVTGISMSPKQNIFLSTSLDKTIRLWDVNTNRCPKVLNAEEENSIVSINPDGVSFAVLTKQTIKMYDMRGLSGAPFATFIFPLVSANLKWDSLKFSPSGQQILLTRVGSSKVYILNAINGEPTLLLEGQSVSNKNLSLEASYTPDSKFVISGSEDGKVHVWNAQTGRKLCVLKGTHKGPSKCVQFNPKFVMMASASSHMGFWLPRFTNSQ